MQIERYLFQSLKPFHLHFLRLLICIPKSNSKSNQILSEINVSEKRTSTTVSGKKCPFYTFISTKLASYHFQRAAASSPWRRVLEGTPGVAMRTQLSFASRIAKYSRVCCQRHLESRRVFRELKRGLCKQVRLAF